MLVGGWFYLAVMIIRYIIRMALYPPERWTGGSIPIFFHWVLAAFVIILGWRQRANSPWQPARHVWLKRIAWGLGIVVVLCGIALWILLMLGPALLASKLEMRPPECAVRVERKVRCTTRDGVDLVADVYHPVHVGEKTPTILVRIPYSKTAQIQLVASIVGRMWAEHGYTVVFQGTRGRFDSGGEYYPLREERQDGLDTLSWLARQPWFDGRLGMWGCSYYGYTQWVLADQSNPGPTALIIQEASTNFHDMFYPGGAFSLKSALHWAVMSRGRFDEFPSMDVLLKGCRGFPMEDSDLRAIGRIPFFQDWVAHPRRDDYWRSIDGENRASRLQAPVLLMGGWFDPFLPTMLADYEQIKKTAKADVARKSRLIIGPWAHAESVPLPDAQPPRNFRLESLAPSIAWFDEHLRGLKPHEFAPVRLFTMGTNTWRDETDWPLARTRYVSYYLHSSGKAQTSSGDGALTLSPSAGDEPTDEFVYDPNDPVPTAGGCMLGDSAGAELQNSNESRGDVLVYSTPPLSEDLEITGSIKLTLYVATTATNTDFTAKLVDVYEDGRAFNVCDGILRQDFTPNQPTEITIDLWPTSIVFQKGHRLRLEVSSSNFPRYDANPNTGSPIAAATKPGRARQQVYHDLTRSSHLILPEIPRK